MEANCGTGEIHVARRRFRNLKPCPRSYPCPWNKGRIVAVWDDSDPYRIMLDSGVEIWASADNDDCLRSVRRPWVSTSWSNSMVWELPSADRTPAAVGSPLRFSVNDTVQVKVPTGHWKDGKITALWGDGFPYHVMFDGGFIGQAAVDTEEFVRRVVPGVDM